MSTLEVGKKYLYGNATSGPIYEVLFVNEHGAFVQYQHEGRTMIGPIPSRDFGFYKEYIEPPKPIKVRTVVALYVPQGVYYVESITDAPSKHGGDKFNDPEWIKTWRNNPNYKIVSDMITEVMVTK